jgi:Polyketide cyclase / dehydrase and lipid transport
MWPEVVRGIGECPDAVETRRTFGRVYARSGPCLCSRCLSPGDNCRMGKAHSVVTSAGTVHQAETAWCDTARWHAWVEGFETIVSVSDDWPAAGAVALWESSPAGRGSVSERVLRLEPLELIESEIEDGHVIARQLVTFTPLQDGVEVMVDFAYRIKGRSPLTPVLDALFVRRAMQSWLQTSLNRFAVELASARE